MSVPSSSRFSRRGLLAAGGAAGLGAFVTACGNGSGESGKSTGRSGTWSFTDDRRKSVVRNGTPRRIVAFTGTAAALHDFGVDEQVVGVFGPTKLPNGRPDPQAGDLEIGRLKIIGNAYGEFGVEKYAATRPDLLVTNMYEPDALWFVPEESEDKILALAPSVAITSSRVSLRTIIERYAELADALGADLRADRVTRAKKRFEDASERVRKAAKSSGLKVAAASGSRDLFYVSNPEINADLKYFSELGVDLVKPRKLAEGGYFEELSWENADTYPADLIILDNRTQALQPADLASKPSWRDLPAVAAGQVSPWPSEPRFSYAGAAPVLESLAEALEKAKKVV